MKLDGIKRLFPNASAATLRRADDYSERVHAVQPEPNERPALVAPAPGEETRWHDAAGRFEIVFTIYSVRPCDWDGWDIKALQDFLITAGIIPDDGWRTLSGRVVSRKVATAQDEKTVITITAFNGKEAGL